MNIPATTHKAALLAVLPCCNAAGTQRRRGGAPHFSFKAARALGISKKKMMPPWLQKPVGNPQASNLQQSAPGAAAEGALQQLEAELEHKNRVASEAITEVRNLMWQLEQAAAEAAVHQKEAEALWRFVQQVLGIQQNNQLLQQVSEGNRKLVA